MFAPRSDGAKADSPEASGETPEAQEWTDARLVEAVRTGDPRAGEALYDRLVRIVEWSIVRVCGRLPGRHEDLVQASFEQILMTLYRKRFKGSCSLTSWAATISCNVALNALRADRQTRNRNRALTLVSPTSSEPTKQLEARHMLARVRFELGSMKPQRAAVLVLHEVNGLPLTEIATALGLSVAATQSLLSRSRRELRARLQESVTSGEGNA